MDILGLFKRPQKDDFFNKFPDGVLIVSLEGKILDANSKALDMFKVSKSEIVGEFFSVYVDGGSNLLNKTVLQKCAIVSKVRVKGADEDSYFEISASRDSIAQKVYVCLRNVTNSYKMQNMVNGQYEIAKNIIDEKNNYLVTISGEILSSLATIDGFSRALSDGVGGVLVDKQMKYVNIINKNAQDLTYDLEKLFTVFRLESNLYQYDFRNFDLINLLNAIVKQYSPFFAKKKIIFESNFAAVSTRACFLDQSVLEYLIKSILDVFIKNVQIGRVTLSAGNPPVAFLEQHDFDAKVSKDTSSYVLFEMKASELFFDEDELQTLFEPYCTLNKNKRPLSTKLTFVLAKKFIKHFKGDIWVYSKPAFGTMVSFVVPLDRK